MTCGLKGHLGSHFGADLVLGLGQPLLGQLGPAVAVGDEGLEMLGGLGREGGLVVRGCWL